MKKEHKLNLLRLALHLLRNEKKGMISVKGFKLRFSMTTYVETSERCLDKGDSFDILKSCGTACCALGDWMILNYNKMPINHISDTDFGIIHQGSVWNYLFGIAQPHSVIKFAERAMDFLRDEECNYRTTFKSKSEAIRELMTEKRKIEHVLVV